MASFRSVANTGHAISWTVFMCSTFLPIYAVTRSRVGFRWATRKWAEGMAGGWGMNVEAVGRDRIDADGTYVFMANHLSHVDIVALFIALPMNVGFLAKKELRRVPFLGQAMVAGGHVFIDRGRRERAVQALDDAARQVAAGASIVVFPEGTRGGEERVQAFKKGGFHLARQANVPIVPVGIRGTRSIMTRDELVIHPGNVSVHIGSPIAPANFSDADSLSDAVRSRIAELSAMPLAQVERASRPATPVPPA
ncbi:MAG: lysophospholipid acyltransferase family protein [Myxococcales bacterium]